MTSATNLMIRLSSRIAKSLSCLFVACAGLCGLATVGCRSVSSLEQAAFTPPHPLFISHRGESSQVTENTLGAFRYAMEHNSDGFETDIHLTADGQLVCLHDCDTQRVFGTAMRVEEHTLAELRTLRDNPEEGVPTLAEALAVLRPGKLIFIEVKDSNPAVVDAMAQDLACSAVKPEQVVVISFIAEMVRYSKEKYPQYKTMWLCGFGKDEKTGEYTDVSYYTGVLKAIRADGIDCCGDFEYMDADFYRAMKEAGLEIMVWTIDSTEDARRFIEDGADGITSNRAASLVVELQDLRKEGPAQK